MVLSSFSVYIGDPISTHNHCFIAMNSEPNDKDSTHIRFLLHQYTNTLLMYTRNPVLNPLGTISEVWSALTFTQMMTPVPLGSGIFGGSSSSLQHGQTC